mmetsp:Transcript_61293/g.179750  ORF Transcript_61293/g.179750 Transcript_61293/m.179750 type:complete len:372 (+) Transcript_61293:24-1139(+)
MGARSRGPDIQSLEHGELRLQLGDLRLQPTRLEVLLQLHGVLLLGVQLLDPLLQPALLLPVHPRGEALSSLARVAALEEDVGVGPKIGHAHDVERAANVLGVEPREWEPDAEACESRWTLGPLQDVARSVADLRPVGCGVVVAPDVRLAVEGDAAPPVEDLHPYLRRIARDPHPDGFRCALVAIQSLVLISHRAHAVLEQLGDDVEEICRDERGRPLPLLAVEVNLHLGRVHKVGDGQVLDLVGSGPYNLAGVARGVDDGQALVILLEDGQVLGGERLHAYPRQEEPVQEVVHEDARLRVRHRLVSDVEVPPLLHAQGHAVHHHRMPALQVLDDLAEVLRRHVLLGRFPHCGEGADEVGTDGQHLLYLVQV